jgi:hypothetical protein
MKRIVKGCVSRRETGGYSRVFKHQIHHFSIDTLRVSVYHYCVGRSSPIRRFADLGQAIALQNPNYSSDYTRENDETKSAQSNTA